MRVIHDDEFEALSVSKASRITGLGRRTITRAMDAWTASHGKIGLRFIQPNERRLVRRAELLKWFECQERMSCYG